MALDELQIVTPSGLVPLANFVTVKPSNNVDTLQRVDGTPIMMILANVAPDVLADTKVRNTGLDRLSRLAVRTSHSVPRSQ